MVSHTLTLLMFFAKFRLRCTISLHDLVSGVQMTATTMPVGSRSGVNYESQRYGYKSLSLNRPVSPGFQCRQYIIMSPQRRSAKRPRLSERLMLACIPVGSK